LRIFEDDQPPKKIEKPPAGDSLHAIQPMGEFSRTWQDPGPLWKGSEEMLNYLVRPEDPSLVHWLCSEYLRSTAEDH